MFNRVVILLFLIYYINCSDFDQLIKDEKHKIISEGKNVRTKVFKGRILTIRPELTAQETDEIDNLMAQSFRVGDPSRPLPDSDEKLEQLLCQGRSERSSKILDYYRKKYPTRLQIRLAIRLATIEINRKNDYYCRDSQTRAYFIRNAKLINNKVNQLKAIRNQFVNNLSYFTNQFGESLSLLLCHYRKYVTQTLSVLQSPEAKNFMADMMESYYGLSLKYISSFLTTDSETCDSETHLKGESGLTPYVKRSQSVQKPLIEALFLSLYCNSDTIRC